MDSDIQNYRLKPLSDRIAIAYNLLDDESKEAFRTIVTTEIIPQLNSQLKTASIDFIAIVSHAQSNGYQKNLKRVLSHVIPDIYSAALNPKSLYSSPAEIKKILGAYALN